MNTFSIHDTPGKLVRILATGQIGRVSAYVTHGPTVVQYRVDTESGSYLLMAHAVEFLTADVIDFHTRETIRAEAVDDAVACGQTESEAQDFAEMTVRSFDETLGTYDLGA